MTMQQQEGMPHSSKSLLELKWHEGMGDQVVRYMSPQEEQGMTDTGPWTGSQGAPFWSDNDSSGDTFEAPRSR